MEYLFRHLPLTIHKNSFVINSLWEMLNDFRELLKRQTNLRQF